MPYVNDPSVDVDVNGDGYADLVGATVLDGSLHLYQIWGGPDFFADVSVSRNGYRDVDSESEGAPSHPVMVGDVDGDGFSDVATFWLREGLLHGVELWHGGEMGLGLTQVELVPVQNSGVASSGEVVWVGDVSCDGVSDVALNPMPLDSGVNVDSFLLRFGPDGSDPDWVRTDEVIRGVGDVNGDGCDDLFVGHQLFLGSADGPQATDFGQPVADYSMYARTPIERPYDLNGDGLADFFFDGDWYLGSAAGLPTRSRDPELVWMNARIGRPVVDLTGDGQLDYLSWDRNNSQVEGESIGAWLFRYVVGRDPRVLSEEQLGREVGWAVVPPLVYQDSNGVDYPNAEQRYLGSPGDIDGDGFADVLADGRLNAFGTVLRGGRRFKAEADTLVPHAAAGWVGVYDNRR